MEIAVTESSTENTDLIIQQVAKMVYLDLPINECDRQIIETDCLNTDHSYYYKMCMRELEGMKETKFYNNMSVFDILMGSDKVVADYARNNELVEALEKGDFSECFPIYFASLNKKFQFKVEQQKFRKKAATTLSNLLNLNDVVNQKILSYMGDENLRFLY